MLAIACPYIISYVCTHVLLSQLTYLNGGALKNQVSKNSVEVLARFLKRFIAEKGSVRESKSFTGAYWLCQDVPLGDHP